MMVNQTTPNYCQPMRHKLRLEKVETDKYYTNPRKSKRKFNFWLILLVLRCMPLELQHCDIRLSADPVRLLSHQMMRMKGAATKASFLYNQGCFDSKLHISYAIFQAQGLIYRHCIYALSKVGKKNCIVDHWHYQVKSAAFIENPGISGSLVFSFPFSSQNKNPMACGLLLNLHSPHGFCM